MADLMRNGAAKEPATVHDCAPRNQAHQVFVHGGERDGRPVDHARAHAAAKRGSGEAHVSLDDALVIAPSADVDVLALDEALTRLAVIDPQQSRVVELRFFGGLTMDETAEVLGISPATVGREWTLAKAWLYGELTQPPR